MRIDDLHSGQTVTWLHELQGGYGYVQPVNAIVVQTYRVKVLIEVSKTTGEKVLRFVYPRNLRSREERLP